MTRDTSPEHRLAAATPAQRRMHEQFLRALDGAKQHLVKAAFCLTAIADGKVHRLLGFASIAQYAEHVAGLSPRQAKELVRMGRHLQALPAIRQAVEDGELSWRKARDIVGRAAPETEQQLLDLARSDRMGTTAPDAEPADSPQEIHGSVHRDTERDDLADDRRGSGESEIDARSSGESDIDAREPGELATHEPTPGEPTRNEPAPSEPAAGRPSLPTAPASDPAPPGPTAPAEPAVPANPAPERLHVSLGLSPVEYARWEALVAQARRRGRRESLGALHVEALAALCEADDRESDGTTAPTTTQTTTPTTTQTTTQTATPTAPPTHRPPISGPGNLLVILACPRCDAATLVTSRGEIPAPRALIEVARCDGIVEREEGAGTGGEPRITRRSIIPARIRRQTMRRDRYRCRAAGCHNTRNLEVHHRVPRADGGPTTLQNLVTLCASCHHQVHDHEAGLAQALAATGDLPPP